MSATMSTDCEKKSDPAMMDVQEEVKLNSPIAEERHTPGVDATDRDPNHLNDHVKVRFSEIFGEPDEEVHSFERIWVLSFKIFTATKIWCYRITSIILGLPCAVCWGLHFACLAFCNVWCFIPCLKSYAVDLACLRKLYEIILAAFLGPCCDAWGRCFSHVRVKVNREVV